MATIEDVKMSLFSALREIQEAEEKGKEVDIEEVYEWITAALNDIEEMMED